MSKKLYRKMDCPWKKMFQLKGQHSTRSQDKVGEKKKRTDVRFYIHRKHKNNIMQKIRPNSIQT